MRICFKWKAEKCHNDSIAILEEKGIYTPQL